MKEHVLSLINEINETHSLEYKLVYTNLEANLAKISFIHKIDEKISLRPVIGKHLNLEYYLLGMLKYNKCLPF